MKKLLVILIFLISALTIEGYSQGKITFGGTSGIDTANTPNSLRTAKLLVLPYYVSTSDTVLLAVGPSGIVYPITKAMIQAWGPTDGISWGDTLTKIATQSDILPFNQAAYAYSFDASTGQVNYTRISGASGSFDLNGRWPTYHDADSMVNLVAVQFANYYTKTQTDAMYEPILGYTPFNTADSATVRQAAINILTAAVAGKQNILGYTPLNAADSTGLKEGELNVIRGNVSTNTANISSNTSNIATNAQTILDSSAALRAGINAVPPVGSKLDTNAVAKKNITNLNNYELSGWQTQIDDGMSNASGIVTGIGDTLYHIFSRDTIQFRHPGQGWTKKISMQKAHVVYRIWSTPVDIYNGYTDSVSAVVVYGGKVANNTLCIFFTKQQGVSTTTLGTYRIYSRDHGRTWSSDSFITVNPVFGDIVDLRNDTFMVNSTSGNTIVSFYTLGSDTANQGRTWRPYGSAVSVTADGESMSCYAGVGKMINWGRNQVGGYYIRKSINNGRTYTALGTLPLLTNGYTVMPSPWVLWDSTRNTLVALGSTREGGSDNTYSRDLAYVWNANVDEAMASVAAWNLVDSLPRAALNRRNGYNQAYGYKIADSLMLLGVKDAFIPDTNRGPWDNGQGGVEIESGYLATYKYNTYNIIDAKTGTGYWYSNGLTAGWRRPTEGFSYNYKQRTMYPLGLIDDMSFDLTGSNGMRFVLDGNKAAMRIGYSTVSTTLWNRSNLGIYSFAGGINSNAFAAQTIAYGSQVLDSSLSSSSFGSDVTASSGADYGSGRGSNVHRYSTYQHLSGRNVWGKSSNNTVRSGVTLQSDGSTDNLYARTSNYWGGKYVNGYDWGLSELRPRAISMTSSGDLFADQNNGSNYVANSYVQKVYVDSLNQNARNWVLSNPASTFTSNTTISASSRVSVIYLDASGGSFSQTLPTGATYPVGTTIMFEKINGTGTVTFDPAGSVTIGMGATYATTFAATAPGMYMIYWDGTKYNVMAAPINVSAELTATYGTAIIPTISITANGVTNAMLRQGTGLSVMGVAGSSTANEADITAGSDFQVLRRSGSTLGFGSINLASTNAVTGVLAPVNGGTGSSTAPSNGFIPIGNGTNYVSAALTAGPGIYVTNAAGSVTIGQANNTITATDANTSIEIGSFEILPSVTGNRTLTLTAGTIAGQRIIIWNKNTSGTFSWTFSSTVFDAASATITTLTNTSFYQLIWDGTRWVKMN